MGKPIGKIMGKSSLPGGISTEGEGWRSRVAMLSWVFDFLEFSLAGWVITTVGNQLCHCHRLRYIKSCSHVFTSNVFLVPGQALKHGWPGKLHVSIWSCFSWIILCRWMDVPPRSFPGPASQRRRAEDSFPAKVFLVQLSGRAGYFLGISKVDVHPGQYVIYSTFMW